jgi:hypothetical protein
MRSIPAKALLCVSVAVAAVSGLYDTGRAAQTASKASTKAKAPPTATTQGSTNDKARITEENRALKALSKKKAQAVPLDRITSVMVTSLARAPIPKSGWEMKEDGGVYYTTSLDTDLDGEVTFFGAKILKSPIDNRYVRTPHKQYPKTCGPATLAMVLEQLGVSNRVRDVNYSLRQDVDDIGASANFSVGYRGSMEHIMWLGYHRMRLGLDLGEWNDGNDNFLSRQGVMNLTASGRDKSFLAVGTDMDYLSFTGIPKWLWNGAPVGCDGINYIGLTGVMNYIFSGQADGPWRDARFMALRGETDAEVVKIRRLLKGYIDHDISLVSGVDGGGHFNAIIGYRGTVSPASEDFWVYTADPLNGWGRAAERQPGTFRRIKVSRDNLGAGGGALMGVILWNHHADGTAAVSAATGTPLSRFRRGTWAEEVDRENGNDWLTGSARQPRATDTLGDRLAVPAARMP